MTDVNSIHREQVFQTYMLGWRDGAANKQPRDSQGTAYTDGYAAGAAAYVVAIHEASALSEHVPDPTQVPRANEIVGY
jgi:hypothetical protein